MRAALELFNQLINELDKTDVVYNHLVNIGAPFDYSDLLRWKWVQVVSSLDKFIHDIVRIGMLQIFTGARPETEKYRQFKLNVNVYNSLSAANAVDRINIFEQYVISIHRYLSFQEPPKICDALSHFWNEDNKWLQISRNLRVPQSERDVRIRLNNIILRRNQIVHEGDCLNNSLPLNRQQIEAIDVTQIILFINDLVNTIYNLVV